MRDSIAVCWQWSSVVSRLPLGNLRTLLVAAALFGLGFFLIGISLAQEINHVGNETLSGTLDLGATVYLLDFEEFSYAEVSWSDLQCGVRSHFLSPLAFEEYDSSGRLAVSDLNCDKATAIMRGTTSHIVMANDRERGANYTLHFSLFVATRPMAWLGVPALVLLFAASFLTIITFLRRVLLRFLTSSSLQKEK